jgi:hypothetical protein
VARAWRNRIPRGDVQLRFGRDRLWYRFVRSGGDWILDSQPAPEPDALLAQAATTR